jgi:transcriptional regulator with XRE-family HTH domain
MTGVEEIPVYAVVSLPSGERARYNGHQMVPRTLGKIFRDVREAKGPAWTQGFVAKKAGLHVSSVVKVEKDRPEVTAETKAKVAAALGTTLEALRAEVTAPLDAAKPTRRVGNSTVDLPFRTRHTTDIHLGRSEMARSDTEENVEMYNADRVAVIATLLTMSQTQVRELRRHQELMLLKDSLEATPGKARG